MTAFASLWTSSRSTSSRFVRHGPRHIARRLRRVAARMMPGAITDVATDEPAAALTFDDGPHPEFTPRLLEVLARRRARATFFMVGEKAHRQPELVRVVAQQGHEIANHSWNHARFPTLTARARRAQIRACAAAIAPYGRRLFRPPHGEENVACQVDTLWLRHTVVAWSLAVDDWCSTDVAWMAERLTTGIRPGSIVLLHDGMCDAVDERHCDREPMLKAVEIALERLAGGFEFVTASELLRTGRAKRMWSHLTNGTISDSGLDE